MNRTLITNIDNVIISDAMIRCSALVIDSGTVHGYGTSLDWPVFAMQIFEPGYDLDCRNETPVLRVGKCPPIYINKSIRAFALTVDTLTGQNTREQAWRLLDERARQFWPRGRMFPTLKREMILSNHAFPPIDFSHPTKSS